MTETFNGRKRIEAALKKQSLDRPAISGWRHMPLVDRDVEAFAEDEQGSDEHHHGACGVYRTYDGDGEMLHGEIAEYP